MRYTMGRGVNMKYKIYTLFCVMVMFISAICCNIGNVFADNVVLDISSKSAILMDYDSKTIVYEKDSTKKLPIASMVKLMTILLTFEELDKNTISLDDMVETSENASGMGGSQVFIDPYVEYKLEDLLKSVIMASANDASVALAEKISGSEEQFVDYMNNRAKELGMNDTIYANSTGLPAPQQYSTAKDCAILLSELLKHEDYHKYSTIWMDELTHPSGRKTELVNTNKLIRYYKYCDSGKTGSTNEAGCCLSASAKQNGLRFIAVVIGAPNSKERFKSATNLFNYGFANYQNKTIIDKNVSISNCDVVMSDIDKIDLYPTNNFSYFAKKNANTDVELVFEVPDKIFAPIKSGTVVGTIKAIKDGNVLCEVNVEVREDVNKLSYKDTISKIAEKW